MPSIHGTNQPWTPTLFSYLKNSINLQNQRARNGMALLSSELQALIIFESLGDLVVLVGPTNHTYVVNQPTLRTPSNTPRPTAMLLVSNSSAEPITSKNARNGLMKVVSVPIPSGPTRRPPMPLTTAPSLPSSLPFLLNSSLLTLNER